MNQGERTLADRGYNDSNYFILPSENNARQHKYLMSRHETINKRIRQFNILKNTFRNSLVKHPLIFHAVVNVTEIIIENGEPLFGMT